MAAVVCLDSHAVVALYLGATRKIGRDATRLLDRFPAVITPTVLLELQMLHEIGRINVGAVKVFDGLAKSIGLAVDDQPWERLMPQVLGQSWTRDPFDRAIVGHAGLLKAPLVTKDRFIHAHYAKAVW